MALLADIDIGRIVSTALIAAIVLIAHGFHYRSAQRESETGFAGRCVDYPKALKIFVWLGWIFTVAFAIIAVFTVMGKEFWPATLFVLLFIGLISPIHLEAYFVRITWDDETIHTHSPWRRSRRIPISSVM